MALASNRRETKKPQWLDEGIDPDDAVEDVPKNSTTSGEHEGMGKYVFVLVEKKHVDKTLVGREVYTLWPDNGRWYKGKVTKCNPADMTAMIFYKETNEKEEANVQELIDEKQIAFCTCVLVFL